MNLYRKDEDQVIRYIDCLNLPSLDVASYRDVAVYRKTSVEFRGGVLA